MTEVNDVENVGHPELDEVDLLDKYQALVLVSILIGM